MSKTYIKIDKIEWLLEAYEDKNNLTLKVKDKNEDIHRHCYIGNFQKKNLKGSLIPGNNMFFFSKELIPIIKQKINENDYYAFTNDTKLHLMLGKENMKHEFVLESFTEMPLFDDKQKKNKKKKNDYKKLIIYGLIIVLFSYLYYIKKK